jgi:AbiV family abortive infection protein
LRRKPENIVVTEELWKNSMHDIANRIITLLNSSELLLDNGGNSAVSAGLYTYSLEEYGKLLFLKRYSRVSGRLTLLYRDEFCDHIKKFSEAIVNLPNECSQLHQGIFDPAIFDPKIFDTQEIVADFEARMAIFYSDFKDSGDELLSVPPIDADKLRVAVAKLRTIIAATPIP